MIVLAGAMSRFACTSLVGLILLNVDWPHPSFSNLFMANIQPASFGDVLSSAWALVKERINLILGGVLLFTVLTSLTQIPLAGLDEEAGILPEQVWIAVVASLASVLVGFAAYLYYLFSVTDTNQSFGGLLKKSVSRIFPFIGLSLLILLRTFAWLALVGGAIMAYAAMQTYAGNDAVMPLFGIGLALVIIGAICGILLSPRYMLAPILWAVEGSGVRESVRRSYDVTRGYWGKVFGNTLLLALIFMIVMVGVGMIADIVASMSEAMVGETGAALITIMITTFFSQFYNVIFIAFLLGLSATIIANPRGVTAPINGTPPAAPIPPSPPPSVKAAVPPVSVAKKLGPKAASKAKKSAPKKPAGKKSAKKK